MKNSKIFLSGLLILSAISAYAMQGGGQLSKLTRRASIAQSLKGQFNTKLRDISDRLQKAKTDVAVQLQTPEGRAVVAKKVALTALPIAYDPSFGLGFLMARLGLLASLKTVINSCSGRIGFFACPSLWNQNFKAMVRTQNDEQVLQNMYDEPLNNVVCKKKLASSVLVSSMMCMGMLDAMSIFAPDSAMYFQGVSTMNKYWIFLNAELVLRKFRGELESLNKEYSSPETIAELMKEFNEADEILSAPADQQVKALPEQPSNEQK